MKYHGIAGTMNMFFGHLTWLSYEGYLPEFVHRPALYLFLASTPCVAFTAFHMGSVAMGTFRVDTVYKMGAMIWMLPFVNALLKPTNANHVLLLGFAQAFCFVRLWSPLSMMIVSFLKNVLGKSQLEYVVQRRWDVAASFGIITGMLLSLDSRTATITMTATMAMGFLVAPLLLKEDHRISAGENGSAKFRQTHWDLLRALTGRNQ